MEMIWRALHYLAVYGALLLGIVLCVQYTAQWTLRNRLIVIGTRFTTVMVAMVLLALVWSSSVASGRFVLLMVEQGARYQAPPPALVQGTIPAHAVEPVTVATGQTSVLGGPSLSVEYMDRVLSAHGSPAA